MKTFTQEQFNQKFGEGAYDIFGQEKPKPKGFLSNTAENYMTGINKMSKGFGQVGEAGQPIEQARQGVPMSRSLNQLGQGALNIVGGGIEALSAPLTSAFQSASQAPGIKQTVDFANKNIVQPTANAISDIPAVQKFAQNNPNAEEVFSNALNIVLSMYGGKKVPKAISETTDVAGNLISKAKTGIQETTAPIAEKVSGMVENQPAKIMQRVARIPQGAQAKFEQVAGESVGEYLVNRGIYGSVDDISSQLYNRLQKSKASADIALEQLPGEYKPASIKTALDELFAREKRVSAPGAISPDLGAVKRLVMKYDRGGLTMSEINEVKRLFERNIRTDYLKSIATKPEGVARATNIDTAIRRWQFQKAQDLGLKNLPAINKETQLSKALLDALGKKYSGQAGNNAMTLTDWIMLSNGDPAAISGFLIKKTFSSKVVQSAIAKYLNKGNPIKGEIVGDISPTVESSLRRQWPQGTLPELPPGTPGTPPSVNVPPNLPGRRIPDEPMTAKPQSPQSQEKLLKQPSKNPTTQLSDLQSTLDKTNIGNLSGGFSYNLKGEAPSSGYMVSPYKGLERTLPVDGIKMSDLIQYAQDNYKILNQDNHYFGGWADGGQFYLDVSKNFDNPQAAVDAALQNNQLGIYSLHEGKSYYRSPEAGQSSFEEAISSGKNKGQNSTSNSGGNGSGVGEAGNQSPKVNYKEEIFNRVQALKKKLGLKESELPKVANDLSSEFVWAETKGKPFIDKTMDEVVKGIDGAYSLKVPLKGHLADGSFNPDRAIIKFSQKGSITDLARGTILVPDIESVPTAVSKLAKKGIKLEARKNFFNKPTYLGYRGANIQIVKGKGGAEIQIQIPEIMYYKEALKDGKILETVLGKDGYEKLAKTMEDAGLSAGQGHKDFEFVRQYEDVAIKEGRTKKLPNGDIKFLWTRKEWSEIGGVIKQSRKNYEKALNIAKKKKK